MDKSSILKAFNNHLFEFVDDIITIFPENNDIKTTKTFFEMTKKGNVTLLIKIWFTFVETPYGEILEQGDLDYFINKDYSEDMTNLTNSADILAAIDKIRKPIKDMTESSKTNALKYLNNLNKLSRLYNNK